MYILIFLSYVELLHLLEQIRVLLTQVSQTHWRNGSETATKPPALGSACSRVRYFFLCLSCICMSNWVGLLVVVYELLFSIKASRSNTPIRCVI